MKENRSWLFIVALLVMGAGTPTSGEKELIIRLQGEVLVLQRQVRDLQEAFDKAQGHSSAQMQKISDNSDGTIRTLAGIEDTLKTAQVAQNNNLSGAIARLNKLSEHNAGSERAMQQLNQQMTALRETVEQYQRRLDAEKVEKEREREQKQANTTPQFNSPEQLYSFAYNQYVRGEYEAATVNFRRYVEAYGVTEATDNALYWIAESLAAQQKLPDALSELERLLADFPKSDKAPAATYKKGVLLLQLERRSDGVAALRNVVSLYPNAQEAVMAGQELQRLGESLQAPPPSTPTKPAGRQRPGRISPQ